jgi:hypothetical protein
MAAIRVSGASVARQVAATGNRPERASGANMRQNVKIADTGRWYDIGSDADWVTFGGRWARPCPADDEPDRWAAIRLDADPAQDCGPVAVAVHVRLSDIGAEVLTFAGVPLDGLDEYGEPVDPVVLAAWKICAYLDYWGAHGPAGGDAFETDACSPPMTAAHVRARAARWLS